MAKPRPKSKPRDASAATVGYEAQLWQMADAPAPVDKCAKDGGLSPCGRRGGLPSGQVAQVPTIPIA